jgi:Flp pilus assembly protein TadD
LASPARYNRALTLYNQGILLEASREVTIYLDDNPDDFEANKLLARILLRLENWSKLDEVTSKLVQMRPNDPEVIALRERAMRDTTRDLPESISDLEELVRAEPGNIGYRIRLIDMYVAQRRYQDAERHYREIVRRRPNDAPFRLRYARYLAQRRRTADAEREYNAYLSLVANDAIRVEMFNVILQDAQRLINEERYPEAVELFEQVSSRYPDDLMLLREYARLLAWAEKYPESIVIYKNYLEREDDPEVRLELARVKAWDDDYAGALTEIRTVLSKSPDNTDAHILKGDIYRWTDNMDDARERYELVLSLDPDNMYALEGLTELARLEERRYEEASAFNVEAMRAAIAEDDEDDFARLQLARLLNIAAQYEESARHYKDYIERHPDDIAARLEYSRVLASLGQYRLAINELNLYLTENPDDLTNRLNMVNLHLWNQDYRTGERLLLAILQDYPQHIEVHWMLFRLYRNREDWAGAKRHLNTIINIDPGYTVAQAYLREIDSHPRFMSVSETATGLPSPYRPTIGFSYGYLRDHEDYSEQYGMVRFIQPLPGDNQLEISYGRFFVNQRNQQTALGNNTLHVRNDRYELNLLGTIDSRTRAGFWLGMNNYRSRYEIAKDNSFFLGARISYEVDDLNRVSGAYISDDAFFFVRTVRSLGGRELTFTDFDDDGEEIIVEYQEQALTVDKFEATWDRGPLSYDDDAPFLEKLSFFGRLGYGMFSDSNRQLSYRIGTSYPLRYEPNVELLIGWDSLNYSEERESIVYWSPQAYEGMFLGAKIEGSWEEFSYAMEGEISFRRGSIGASRSLSGRLYYEITERLSAGLIASYSESPREGDEDYNFLTTIIDLYYRF